jgi:hypothetical protein
MIDGEAEAGDRRPVIGEDDVVGVRGGDDDGV